MCQPRAWLFQMRREPMVASSRHPPLLTIAGAPSLPLAGDDPHDCRSKEFIESATETESLLRWVWYLFGLTSRSRHL